MWLIFSRRDADRAAIVLPDERPGGEDKAQEERHKSGALDRDCIVFFVEGRGPGSRRRKSRPSGQASRECESKDGDFVVPILIVEKAPGGESPRGEQPPSKDNGLPCLSSIGHSGEEPMASEKDTVSLGGLFL